MRGELKAIRESNLLTVGQAARVIGLDTPNGRRRVRRIIHRGALRAENHGSIDSPFWLIPERALVDYLISVGRMAPREVTLQ